MSGSLSVSIGNFLYKYAFPLYNRIYPLMKNKMDKREIELVKKLVKPGMTVLDIGSNIGFYTKILSKLTGDKGSVYAFEPDATNFRRLQKNVSTLRNVRLKQAAVSSHDGNLTIYTSTLLNVDHRTYPIEEFGSSYQVDCLTIDTFLPNSIKIDFIKIDIQGYEVEAFKGMKRVLTSNPNIHIVAEFWPYGLKQAQSSVGDYLSLLGSFGLNVWLVKENTLQKISTNDIDFFNHKPKEEFFNVVISPKDLLSI